MLLPDNSQHSPNSHNSSNSQQSQHFDNPVPRSQIQLPYHVDQESAYLILNVPYDLFVTTTARYWVETKHSLGQRLVSQLQHPTRRYEWRAPKCEKYTKAIVLMFTETDPKSPKCGHIQTHHFDIQDMYIDELIEFAQTYYFDPDYQQFIIQTRLEELVADNPENNFSLEDGAVEGFGKLYHERSDLPQIQWKEHNPSAYPKRTRFVPTFEV